MAASGFSPSRRPAGPRLGRSENSLMIRPAGRPPRIGPAPGPFFIRLVWPHVTLAAAPLFWRPAAGGRRSSAANRRPAAAATRSHAAGPSRAPLGLDGRRDRRPARRVYINSAHFGRPIVCLIVVETRRAKCALICWRASGRAPIKLIPFQFECIFRSRCSRCSRRRPFQVSPWQLLRRPPAGPSLCLIRCPAPIRRPARKRSHAAPSERPKSRTNEPAARRPPARGPEMAGAICLQVRALLPRWPSARWPPSDNDKFA